MPGESNDHDILIRLDANLETMMKNYQEFMKDYQTLASRVSVLENKDSRDSEKFKGITEEIRRSLNNAGKIDLLTEDINHLGENFRRLESKSFRYDIAILLGTIVAGVIAWFK